MRGELKRRWQRQARKVASIFSPSAHLGNGLRIAPEEHDLMTI